jgi:hypothetical protein
MAQDDAFKQGLQARGDRKWPDVARHMQAAVKADPQESTRKVRSGIGGVFGQGTEYLPHFFLGEAYFNLQDCGGAVTEWVLSEQQGALKSRTDLVGIMRKGYQACAAKGVLLQNDYMPLYLSTRQTYMDASSMWKRVADLGTSHKELWRAELVEQHERARRELEASSNKLNAGIRSRLASDFNESKAAADRAVASLRPMEATLNTAIETVTNVQRQSGDIEQLIAGADATDRAIDSVKASLTDAMAASRKSGREQLAQARERLAAVQKQPNPATANEALKYAQSASTTFTQVLEQVKKLARGAVEQQLGDAVRAVDEAFSRVSAAMTTLDRRSAQRPDVVSSQMTTDRAVVEKQVEGLRRRFERARKNEDLTSLAETARLALEAQAALDKLIESFGPLTLRDRGVHAALEEGARLYLGGEYQKAVAALEPAVGLPDVPLRLHVHLFRAASLFALYTVSGESNAQLRAQALADVEQCKQLNSTFVPDARVFSPRFLTFYQSGGTQAPATVTQQ